MGESQLSTEGYVLGSAPSELQRLILQDRILRPITERLLRQAGIEEGMRVLDIGCGAGGVSLLAAEMVGPYGSVVGIDQSADAVAVAKECARKTTFQQPVFFVSSVEAFSSMEPVDIVVGRYVLIYQHSPAAFIRVRVGMYDPAESSHFMKLPYIVDITLSHRTLPGK
jgi:2-polyprenyl-3-methyl-5-hydroxy-6-metoxy-1,4-benzoquinol methylase